MLRLSFEKKIFDLLLTGSEIQNGRRSAFVHGFSKYYYCIKTKFDMLITDTMVGVPIVFGVNRFTGSGSNRDFRKSGVFGVARKLGRNHARDLIFI